MFQLMIAPFAVGMIVSATFGFIGLVVRYGKEIFNLMGR
jgi:hypothetical protein